MKKLITILIAVFFFYTQNSAQTHHFKFNVNSKKEINEITRIISIDNVKKNTVWAYANDKEFTKFEKLGYKIEELPLHENNAKVINMATTVAQMANWDRYPTYDVYVQMMQDFANNYPNLCKLDTIGYSQNNRLVLVLKISDNVSQNEAEPEFFYTSTMHGDETTGFVLMLRLADYLLSNYGTDTEVTNLVDNFEIYINPDANPDGTYYGGNNDVSGSVRSLANGQDPNRDYPDPRTGANTPYSQETQDMMTFADNHHFVMSANFHGGAEVYNYPWDTWTSSHAHADDGWFQHIGTSYVTAARTQNSSYMTDVTSSGITEGGDWYVVTGGRQDYMNYEHHCKEVTIELSSSKTLSSDLLPAYWNYNKQSLLNYIKEANYGFHGTVKNTNGDPLNAKIEITSHDTDNSWVVTDPANGDYYRPIAPGTYDVTYSSYGYISQTISVTVSNWETTTIQNVVLQQASTVTVTGTVTEDGTGNPLENVKIEFLNEPAVSPVYTDASGNYTVPNVMENTYDIKASKSGYTAVIQNVNITTTNTVVDFTLAVSNAISFESNVPSIFTFGGNLPWVQVTDQAYDGTNSMKSGNITDNQTSVMQAELNITAAGNISFYKKVSSEATYDYLKFYIDGTQKGEWSGEVDWSQESYAVTTGTHIFKWEYSKDGSASNGSDCAWVDYIEFPQYEIPPTYTVTFNVSDGTNPIENATVTFNSQNKNTDASGHAVFTEIDPANNLPWSVSKTGYNTENGTLNVVDADVNKDVTLTEIVTYSVTFNVSDASSNPIENATINFNSQNITTDAGGQAVFNSVEPGNNLPYTVAKTGYDNFNGTLNVVDADVNENVSMNETSYTVTFTVNDGTNPVEGANVNFNSEDIQTDATGKAVFNNVSSGNNLPYVITKTGFNTYNGNLNVSNSNVYQTVSLNTVNVDVLLKLSGIKIYPNPTEDFATIEFYLEKTSDVELNIFSYEGKKVKTIKKDNLNAGNNQIIWNTSDNSGNKVSTGVYFISIKTGKTIRTEKVILIN